jgi:hypothetical protein
MGKLRPAPGDGSWPEQKADPENFAGKKLAGAQAASGLSVASQGAAFGDSSA